MAGAMIQNEIKHSSTTAEFMIRGIGISSARRAGSKNLRRTELAMRGSARVDTAPRTREMIWPVEDSNWVYARKYRTAVYVVQIATSTRPFSSATLYRKA